MKFLELARNAAFWFLEGLKGNPNKKHLDDIKDIMLHWEDKAVRERRQKYLDDILQYAVSNIEYYRKYAGFKSLNDFPVVNKAIIRENDDLFFNHSFERKNLFKQETSGSTSMPFAVYQDAVKRRRATADTLFFSQMANYEVGSRLYFSRVWDKETTRSPLKCLMQNWVQHDSSSLSEKAIVDLLNAWDNDPSTKVVLIFASTLTAIAKYAERNNYYPKTKIESFITVSEALEPWTKETIQKRFNTNVYSRYSDQELGIMAQQKDKGSDFIVNVASYNFELLDFEGDYPVKDGELGRIVVTDLFNHSMPLIRYDTGDIAIRKPGQKEGEVPLFEKIGGRRVDYIFDTKGGLVSPYVINTPMHEFLEIQQYQFIQEDEKKYRMLLNLNNGNEFQRENDMRNMLKSYLGSDAQIEVEYVNEIPVLKSGKRKQVVNKYKQA